MKKRILLSILFISSAISMLAQVESKYLAGAVPLVDGSVVFKRSIKISSEVSQDKLFDLLDSWAKEQYKTKKGSKQRLLLSDKSKMNIACQGEDKIVFSSSTLSHDMTMINYYLILTAEKGECNIEVRRIRYSYVEYDNLVAAEDMITDKMALNKDEKGLDRHYGKFRISTIDWVDNIRQSIFNYLDKISIDEVKQSVAPSVISTMPEDTKEEVKAAVQIAAGNTIPTAIGAVQGLANYRNIDADRIPGNIIKMLRDDWTLVTSGKGDKINTMTASWGGLGRLWEKPISISFINPTRHTIATMDAGDVYTISFYTETYRDALKYCGSTSGKTEDKISGSGLTPIKTPSGATAFAEAWMILECKKILAQPISESAVVDKEVAKQGSKDGYHTIYIGEILNVWVK